MIISHDPPNAKDLYALIPSLRTMEITRHILASGALWTMAYEDDELVAATWCVGDGRTWITPVQFVAEEHRGKGYGRAIRVANNEWAAEHTKGPGTIGGIFHHLGWEEKIPGTEVVRYGVRDVRDTGA